MRLPPGWARQSTTQGTAMDPQAIEAWRGESLELSLDPDDLELVDNVLYVIPEVRAVALLGKEARKRGVEYPITGAEQLVELLRDDRFVLLGHVVDSESIRHALAEEWFPMAHEGELLSAIHLAFRRCQAEHTAALREHYRSGTIADAEAQGRPAPKAE